MTDIDKLALAVHEHEEAKPEPIPPIEEWHNGAEPRHHQIARLTALGYKTDEVARVMEMTPAGVRSVKSSPLFRAVVRELESRLDENVTKARLILLEAAPKAAATKVELMEGALDMRLRSDNASDILKATGVIKNEAPETRGPVFNIKAEQVQLIETTLKELADARSRS